MNREDHRQSMFQLARVLDWAGKYDEARHVLTRSLEVFGPQGDIYAQLGMTVAKQGNHGEAIHYLEKAITLGHEEPWVYTWLANAYRLRGDFSLAMKAYEDKLQLDGNELEAHMLMGTLYALQKEIELARHHFAAALRLDPGNLPVRMNLVSALYSGGAFDDALREGQALLEHHPEAYQTHYVVGSILLNRGKSAAAIDHFSEALRVAPDFSPARAALNRARRD